MTITYDPTSGRLRISADGLDALGLLADASPGSATSGELLQERDIAVLMEHPAIDRIADTLSAPLLQQSISAANVRDVFAHEVWVGASEAVVALQVPDRSYDLFPLDPSFVPILVARLLGLRPRPRQTVGRVPLTAEAIEGLFEPEAATRLRAGEVLADLTGEQWPAFGNICRGGTWTALSTQTRLRSGELHTLTTVGGAAGFLAVLATESGSQLVPADSSQLWFNMLEVYTRASGAESTAKGD